MKSLRVIPIVFLLFGCAIATGPRFSGLEEPPPNQSDIYVFRTEGPGSESRTGSSPAILVNGKAMGVLRRDGYLKFRVNPGTNVVSMGPRPEVKWTLKKSVPIQVTGGRRYFVRLHSDPGGTTYYAARATKLVLFSFDETSEQEAAPLLKSLSLSQ